MIVHWLGNWSDSRLTGIRNNNDLYHIMDGTSPNMGPGNNDFITDNYLSSCYLSSDTINLGMWTFYFSSSCSLYFRNVYNICNKIMQLAALDKINLYKLIVFECMKVS